VIGALLHTQIHTHIAVEVERAICKISGSASCGEPGVPKAQDSGDDPPGKPDREVHDAECSGGIAGRRDRLIVQPDGSARLTVREKTKSIRLSDAELAKLGADLDRTDLASVPKDSTADRPVPDAFGYRVSYGGATVTTDDPGMPKELRGLVARLGALVDHYGGR
jgi:hypothetical protein